nr:MAG TPA: hypothetical protein [Caudoviricetes sp.]
MYPVGSIGGYPRVNAPHKPVRGWRCKPAPPVNIRRGPPPRRAFSIPTN